MERKAKAITTQLKGRFHPAGDRCLIVEFGQKIAPDINRAVRSLAAYLLQHPLAGVTDVVPAFATVAIHYRPEAIEGLRAGASPHNLLCEQVQAILIQGLAPQQGDARWVEIPVCYEGEFAPDLAEVATLCKLTHEQVIERHGASPHFVYMLGFAPGFAYIGGLDKRLAVPRRMTPRTRIPAGSVAIADELSAIYPLQTPGGWNVIGRTPLKLFDSTASPPCLLLPGDEVHFVAISMQEFQRMSAMQS
ncbi:MAG: 5-oxoprolinase subunit PxpB [Burkholderiales bacterium]